MRLVGIIANPASGKDIRRVVARGLTVPDHEKINILRRMLVGINALGVDAIRWLPDSAGLVERAASGLQLGADARALDQDITNSALDTEAAAAGLRDRGAGCIVVLGGDGTCRAAAKGAGATPLLPISTGTNNAFPQFIEGTLAGLAAAVVARSTAGEQDRAAFATQQPWLRIIREGVPVDVALIDVVSFEGMVGAKAVWQMERVRQLLSVRHQPGTIGLSAVAGYLGLTPPDQPAGLAITLAPNASADGSRQVLAPIAPGVVEPVTVNAYRWLTHGTGERIAHAPCVLALDGERELPVRTGMLVDVQFDRFGPWVVDVDRALQLGVQSGLFDPLRLQRLAPARVSTGAL
ncbi:MAG: NAD(+)/NADH kinase [Chloroflexota bacterium]|nr:NAD(+)/NADH kinase [Chloroflexota bacterium]